VKAERRDILIHRDGDETEGTQKCMNEDALILRLVVFQRLCILPA